MRKIILAAGAYSGAIIGAGFASGQEAVSYFVRFGSVSIFGILIACVIFGLFGYAVTDGCRGEGVCGFNEYLTKRVSASVADIVPLAVRIFMVSVFVAMISGGTELLWQLYGIPQRYGAMVICGLCAAAFLMGNRRLIAFNSVLGLVLCVSLVIVCVYALNNRDSVMPSFAYKWRWVTSAGAYAGYNVLTAGAVVGNLKLKSRKDCVLFGAVSFVVMSAVSIFIWTLLSIYSGKIYLGEIPMLTIVMRSGRYAAAFFSLILLVAMLTTAASTGLGAVERLSGRRRVVGTAVLCVSGYLLSGIRFSFIVDVVYRICGYVGVILLIIIFFAEIKFNIVRKLKKIRDIKSKI